MKPESDTDPASGRAPLTMAGENLTAAELRARIEEQRALQVTLREERATATREIDEARARSTPWTPNQGTCSSSARAAAA